ncbi:MAG TPA: phosphoribosylamine--glycine ligase, partial [Dongiaceae bacterium]
MRILVVGGGGREHALCWSIAASPLCDALFCAPGNAGIAEQAQCVPIAADNITRLVEYAREQRIDFVVVGPEGPLVLGLVDRLREAGIPAFGPNADAAALEGSKGFMKDLCARYGIPTADYARFRDAAPARAYVESRPLPIVVKADGLAAGKGVVIAETREQAIAAIDSMLVGNVFGSAGAEVVIEEFMGGEEVSIFALTDGKTALALASAQDHKRVGDGDTGPNTGGMGAYSPAPMVTPAVEGEVMERIILPTVRAMRRDGRA